jgi:hypothetical protein
MQLLPAHAPRIELQRRLARALHPIRNSLTRCCRFGHSRSLQTFPPASPFEVPALTRRSPRTSTPLQAVFGSAPRLACLARARICAQRPDATTEPSSSKERHLHRYLAEFDFRYSNRIRLGVDDVERTKRALRGIVGKRLTYRTPAN